MIDVELLNSNHHPVPSDSLPLRLALTACLPSLHIDGVAAQSGQRVVYFAHFEDGKIPTDIPPDVQLLRGWESWGRVVIKVVSGVAPSSLTRLQAESALLEELQSEYFPRLLYSEYYTVNPLTDDQLSEPLYVSIEEYVESDPLSRLLDTYLQNASRVFNLASQLTTALTPLWSHKRRYVHRDLKPENILIRPNGRIVVIDFGIVRETGVVGITEEGWGKAPLTVDYAAPEQIANEKNSISYKTDFFSIGVLMYRLLSGVHPFHIREKMHPFEVAEAVENHEPKSLNELGLCSSLQSDVVKRLMQKKPYLRYRTISELEHDLRIGGATT